MNIMTNRIINIMMLITRIPKIKMNNPIMKIVSHLRRKVNLNMSHQRAMDRNKRKRKMKMNKVILVIMHESCLPLMNEYRISLQMKLQFDFFCVPLVA